FFTENNFLKNHYSNRTVQDLISKEATNPDKSSRSQQLGQIQEDVAKDLSTLPLLQGSQVAVAGKSVKGVDSTLGWFPDFSDPDNYLTPSSPRTTS
ncbi:hypothetical protein CTI14_51825, partial [Methylobacterium radiotolerans]